MNNLPQGLYSSAVLACDGKIYVVSGEESYAICGKGIGVTRYDNLVKKMFIYDIARDAWKKCRHSFKARIGHAVHCYKTNCSYWEASIFLLIVDWNLRLLSLKYMI